jgi:CheY-like chemotaxis protein
MRTRQSLRSFGATRLGRVEAPLRAFGGEPRFAPVKPAILLVSTDSELAGRLRHLAEGTDRTVVQAGGLAAALEAVHSAALAAVLLDLDMAAQGAWEIADALVQEPGCPALVLLTNQPDHFDTSAAIRAGALVDKSGSPAALLEAVDEAVALPEVNRAERNAIQRVVIRWLKPCEWSIPVRPSYRDWGLNE